MQNLAIVGSPLSYGFRKRFEDCIADSPAYCTLLELRQLPPLQLIKRLWSIQADILYVPLEEESMRMALPVLEMLAGFTRAKRLEVVSPALERRPITRLALPASLAAFGTANAAGQLAIWRAGKETSSLLKAPRMEMGRFSSERPLLYLKTSLMLGVKAGGSVGHIAGVINGLVDLGFTVDMASAERAVSLAPQVEWVPVPFVNNFSVPIETNYYRYHYKTVSGLLPRMKKRGYGALYQRLSIGNFAGVELARRQKIPLILEYNGSEAWIAKNWGTGLRYQELAEKAEQACLKHAHLVVTISDILRDELLERGVEAERIVNYPNCIDPKVYSPERFSQKQVESLREELGIPKDAVVATFVGTFGTWHGTEVLAQAIRKLVDEDQGWLEEKKVRFLIVGDGHKMPKVRSLLSGKYSTFATLTGLIPQAQTPLYLAASDILVSPHVANSDGSRFFGSPTKLFEYMAMARGIVASDLEQIGEVLRPSLTVEELPERPPRAEDPAQALLVRPGNREDLIRGIHFLVESEAWRKHLGVNARRTALAKYTWEHHVSAILDRIKCL